MLKDGDKFLEELRQKAAQVRRKEEFVRVLLMPEFPQYPQNCWDLYGEIMRANGGDYRGKL